MYDTVLQINLGGHACRADKFPTVTTTFELLLKIVFRRVTQYTNLLVTGAKRLQPRVGN